ncbi:MAG TPA: ROK family protein [Candidatus Binatia bacterium]|nr:ROK family protein [Candidatus Binatia bacterium]
MDNENVPKRSIERRKRRAKRREVRTLAVDIGGSGIKAVVMDERGRPLTVADRANTPENAAPRAVLRIIQRLARKQGQFDRVSVGFPGVVRNGVVCTEGNLHPKWFGFNLARKLEKTLKRPARALNDADMQGFGAISGRGVELVITLGTGLGSALFVDGRLVPNVEMGYDPLGGKSYQNLLGNKARKKIGNKKWNRRVRRAIDAFDQIFHYDALYIGGGNSDRINFKLPSGVRTVSNVSGLLGGIALWK